MKTLKFCTVLVVAAGICYPRMIAIADACCFSSSDTVDVKHRGAVLIKNLPVGQKVLVDNGFYETVYGFGFHEESQNVSFLEIRLGNYTKPLEFHQLSMIAAVSKDGFSFHKEKASRLKVGDLIFKDDSVHKVSHVSRFQRQDYIFMPLTASGKIVVNGIAMSTYPSGINGGNPILSSMEQRLLHIWLGPFRIYCIAISAEYCQENLGIKYLDPIFWLSIPRNLVSDISKGAFEQLRFVILVVPIMFLLVVLSIAEMVVGPSMVPVWLLLSVFIWARNKVVYGVRG